MPPAAISPTPVIISGVGSAGCPKTLPQSVSATRCPRTSTEKPPKSHVAHVLHVRTALMPRPEIENVATTKAGSVATIRNVLLLMPKSTFRTVSRA
jgi:hypothetical protein